MSIKNIDSQIMIARTTDFARDASAAQRKPEVAQDYQAIREKLMDAQEQSRVAKSLDTQRPELNPDEGEGGSYYGEGAESGEKKEIDETGADMLVPPGNNVIDIRV